MNQEHWVNVDQTSRSIIAICNDQIRNNKDSAFNYRLRASDVKGASKDVTVQVIKTMTTQYQIAPFEVTFEVSYNGNRNRPMVYETMYLMQQIKSFYDMTKNPSIYIKKYTQSPGFPNYKSLTWTSCTGNLCSTNGILDRTKTLYDSRKGQLSSTFISAFSPQFDVQQLR